MAKKTNTPKTAQSDAHSAPPEQTYDSLFDEMAAQSKTLNKALENLKKAAAKISEIVRTENQADGSFRPWCSYHGPLDDECMTMDEAYTIMSAHAITCHKGKVRERSC